MGIFFLFFIIFGSLVFAQQWPDPSQLPVQVQPPDPMVMFNGQRITTYHEWVQDRAPELKSLMTYYEYGTDPAPGGVGVKINSVNTNFLGGKATMKDISLFIGPLPRKISLMLVIPNSRSGPSRVFVGLNFCGNHELLNDTSIPIPTTWMGSCPGVVNNKATEAGRGKETDVWAIEQSIDRGYAVATVYYGDIQPDHNNTVDGILNDFEAMFPGMYTWNALKAWAWGLSRIVDYLEVDADIDRDRIAVVGHSRLAKVTILSAAFDKRFALAVPSEAGQGGTAPARTTEGETLTDINTNFPYWFTPMFQKFNNLVTRLPYDHHCLVALCAPRPVLVLNAVQDTWGNPPGTFQLLTQASPVYLLMGTNGLAVQTMPPINQLVNSTLGYVIVPGGHSMTTSDWKLYLDFADGYLTPK